MSNLVYAGLFVLFVAIAIAVRVTKDRRAVAALFGYVIAVHVLLVVTRRDAWPFVTHGAFFEASDANRPFSSMRFIGVDAQGKEHRIDPGAWRAVSDRTLSVWWLIDFQRLSPADQRTVMTFLFDRAHGAIRSWIARAPAWYSVDLPPPAAESRFVALRAYLVTRVPARPVESARLIAEYRP